MSHGSTIGSARRYYLLKRLAAVALRDDGLALVWQHKQESEPGVSLPSDFPSRSVLVAAGYSAAEDLRGAGTSELADIGLTTAQASTVLAALAAL